MGYRCTPSGLRQDRGHASSCSLLFAARLRLLRLSQWQKLELVQMAMTCTDQGTGPSRSGMPCMRVFDAEVEVDVDVDISVCTLCYVCKSVLMYVRTIAVKEPKRRKMTWVRVARTNTPLFPFPPWFLRSFFVSSSSLLFVFFSVSPLTPRCRLSLLCRSVAAAQGGPSSRFLLVTNSNEVYLTPPSPPYK